MSSIWKPLLVRLQGASAGIVFRTLLPLCNMKGGMRSQKGVQGAHHFKMLLLSNDHLLMLLCPSESIFQIFLYGRGRHIHSTLLHYSCITRLHNMNTQLCDGRSGNMGHNVPKLEQWQREQLPIAARFQYCYRQLLRFFLCADFDKSSSFVCVLWPKIWHQFTNKVTSFKTLRVRSDRAYPLQIFHRECAE